MTFKHLSFVLVLGTILLTSCSSDSDPLIGDTPDATTPDPTTPDLIYKDGILLNGINDYPNHETSFLFYLFNNGTTQIDIFEKVNSKALGRISRIGFKDNLAFLLEGSKKTIEVVDRYTFKTITTITSLSSIKYGYLTDIAFVGEKAYVGYNSGADTGGLAIINLKDYSLETNIPFNRHVNRILEENGLLYVLAGNSSLVNNGGDLRVINPLDNSTITTYELGTQMTYPSMTKENGILYIGLSGFYGLDQNALIRFNMETNTLIDRIYVPKKQNIAGMLVKDGILYYTTYENGSQGEKGLYAMKADAATIPSNPIFSDIINARYLQGLVIKDNTIYVALGERLLNLSLEGKLLKEYQIGKGHSYSSYLN